MARDNFTKPTIDILGKRVGFLCSNPDCRKHTIGPNEDPEKATLIGIAAHITAAAANGPRYDAQLTESERIHIDNGIWLCSNCATLIDKDQDKFSVVLLKKWKKDTEDEMMNHLIGKSKKDHGKSMPFLEADLIWAHGRRRNAGYSDKNPKEKGEDGREYMVIRNDKDPIIFWEIRWNFKFTIHNNSEVPAYNISVEPISDIQFDSLSSLNKINNLPALKSVDLEAEHNHFLEDVYSVADKVLLANIPEQLNGLVLRISYQDDDRNTHSTIVKIENGEIINIREK